MTCRVAAKGSAVRPLPVGGATLADPASGLAFGYTIARGPGPEGGQARGTPDARRVLNDTLRGPS
jgi:hypothetical protein